MLTKPNLIRPVAAAILLAILASGTAFSGGNYAHRLEGKKHYQRAEFEEAYQEYMISIELNEDNLPGYRNGYNQSAVYWAYKTMAKKLHRPLDAEEAILSGKKRWSKDPEWLDAVGLYYWTYHKDLEKAKEYYRVSAPLWAEQKHYNMASQSARHLADLTRWTRESEENITSAFELSLFYADKLSDAPSTSGLSRRKAEQGRILRQWAEHHGEKRNKEKQRQCLRRRLNLYVSSTDINDLEELLSWMLRPIASCYLDLEEHAKAIPYLEELHKRDHASFRSAYQLSQCYEKLGKLNQALVATELSMELMELRRAKWKNDTEKRLFGDYWAWLRAQRQAIKLNMMLGRKQRSFELMEMAKGRSMLDLLGSEKPQTKTLLLSEQETKERILSAKINEISDHIKKEQSHGNSDEVASLERSLVLVQEQIGELREDIDNCKAEISSISLVTPLNVEDTQSFIGNVTIISYWGSRFMAVITSNTFDVIDSQYHVEKMTHQFCESLLVEVGRTRGLEIESEGMADSKSSEIGRTNRLQLAKSLYDNLLRPVEHLIKTDTVYIMPEAHLNMLPFHALHDGEKYVAEKYAISYIPSAGILKLCMARRHSEGLKILALGNPNLRDARYKLAYAEDEVTAIGDIYPNSKVLVGSEATEIALKLLSPDYDILHLACHGDIDAKKPMLSSLRLAPDKENDGYLHAREIYDLRLNARLVTLSACESGLGELLRGNEIVGLPRAMMYAGTPSVLASLWKVDDKATSELMVDFYKNLTTMNKAESLRQAQIKMIKAGKEPFYWAAFCLHGDYM